MQRFAENYLPDPPLEKDSHSLLEDWHFFTSHIKPFDPRSKGFSFSCKKIQSPEYSQMGYSGQIFHFNAYSTRIPHAAVFAREKGAKTYGLISKIHNKKVSVLRRNYCKAKKDGISLRIFRRGPSVEIRTQGLLNPIQARYQTSPHPDMQFAVRQLCYITTPFPNLQALIWNFSKNFFAGSGFLLDNGGWIWYSISCVWDWNRAFSHTERWLSGRKHRSWKPAMWEHPWVRIPLSPPIL